MLLGILSDTHDQYDRTKQAVDDLAIRGAEAIVHCGDLASPEIIEICSRLPFHFVFGNHDADVVPELEAAASKYNANCLGWGGRIDFNNTHVAVAHGHMTMDIKPLLNGKPDYLLTGHTHEPADWLQGNTRRICPGALHRAGPLTYALLDLQSSSLEFIELPE